MAGLHIYRSPRCNLLLGGEDKLAKSLLGALTKGNNTSTPFLAISWAQTLFPTLTPTPPSNKGLFQQFMKAYLENQN